VLKLAASTFYHKPKDETGKAKKDADRRCKENFLAGYRLGLILPLLFRVASLYQIVSGSQCYDDKAYTYQC